MPSASRLSWFSIVATTVIFVAANLAMHPLPNTYRMLAPWPDAPQYLDAARTLVEEGRYHIHVAGQEVPPRFPPGYSVLLALAYRAGVPLLTCPLWVNRLFALAFFVLLITVFAGRGMWTTAGLAVLLLATRTSFTVLTRSPLSDLPAGLFLLAGVLLLYRAARTGDRRLWVTALFILGLALCFRWGFLLLYGLIPVAAYLGRHKVGARTLALAGIAFLVGVAPVLVYHHQTFGSVISTGYSFWLPETGQVSGAFHLEYFEMQSTALWNDFIQSEPGPSTAHLFGGGSYIAPCFVLLSGFALWTLRRRVEIILFAVPCAVYVGLLLIYFSVDIRLYFSLILLAVPVVALGVSEAWRDASKLGRAALGLLVAATLIGFPGSRSDTDLGDMMRTPNLHIPAPEWETVEAFNQEFTAPRTLLLTDMDPVYVHVLTDGERTVVPLQNDHDYSYNPANFRFGDAERSSAVRFALEQGIPVLALTARTNLDALQPMEGRMWREGFRNSWGGGIATLVNKEQP